MHNLTKEQIFDNFLKSIDINKGPIKELLQISFNRGYICGENNGYQEGYLKAKDIYFERGQNSVRTENCRVEK